MRKHTKDSLVTSVILLTITVSISDTYCQNAKQDVVAGIPVNYDEGLYGETIDHMTHPTGIFYEFRRAWGIAFPSHLAPRTI